MGALSRTTSQELVGYQRYFALPGPFLYFENYLDRTY